MSDATPRRFVLLEHTWDGVHYDLMLERDGVLKTWRLPSPLTAGTQHATALPDHRLAYLDYEGPLTGNRGAVRRLAAGTYVSLADDGTTMSFTLDSDTLAGALSLWRGNDTNWTLIFQPLTHHAHSV